MLFSLKARLMRRRRIRIIIFIFATLTQENTSLLVNNSNISLLFPPDTFMVITFAASYCVYLKAELFSCADCTRSCCGTLNTVEPLLTVTHGLVLFPPAWQFFSSLIYGCLKYKNKEKPKTGPRPGPHLNYVVKIGLLLWRPWA